MRRGVDAQADMPSERASGATCVQKLDDSRNSAIHITYRISLRSSSLQEPRYPLLRVVSVTRSRGHRPASPGGGERGRPSGLSHSFSAMFGALALHPLPLRREPGGRNARAPAGAMSAPGRRRGASRAAARAAGRPRAGRARAAATHPTGAPSSAGSGPPAAPPDAAPHWTSTVRRVCSIGVSMILPQVHLRKPCYDFSFL